MTTQPHSGLGLWSVDSRWSKLMAFDGLPTERNLQSLLDKAESLVVQRPEDRRVFRAVIECLQNLERHAPAHRPVRFELSGRSVHGEPRFNIRSLNPVNTGEEVHVSAWVDRYAELHQLAAACKEAGSINWRNLHRSWLSRSERTPKGGAGLGWVSMARIALAPPKIRLIHANGGPNLFFSVEVACGG